MPYILFLISLLCSFSVYAGLSFSDNHLVIETGDKAGLYVLCSKKQTSLHLDRVINSPGASAGWAIDLMPFSCAILFADQGTFSFYCQEKKGDVLTEVNCKDYLLSSQFPWKGTMLYGPLPQGSYWLAENYAADDLSLVLRHANFCV